MSYKQDGGYGPDHPASTIKSYAQPKGTNQYTGYANDGRSINKGRGPTTAGQTGDSTPNTTAKSGKINGGRSWTPQAGQNYKGNPDSINSGRGPTKGNAC